MNIGGMWGVIGKLDMIFLFIIGYIIGGLNNLTNTKKANNYSGLVMSLEGKGLVVSGGLFCLLVAIKKDLRCFLSAA
ncbi:hypothetical protein DMA11_17215 [Marinilabiliaceae bacterium JC017]|nr:hypothetical protein DMA11_17215 [Marinilabiliaceae bacterium JC017]